MPSEGGGGPTAEGAPPARRILVLATGNRGKLDELKSLLFDLPFHVRAVGDVTAEPPLVVEDGETFAENALKKARAVALATGMLALADDSGLEVDALDGRPGVRSARFAGEGASGRPTDAENNAALVAALDASGKTPPFRARMRCVLALVEPRADGAAGGAREWTVDGACEGTIARTPRGTGGFGYDPLFLVDGTTTMAELDPETKNRVSHRARALAVLRPLLARITCPADRSAPRSR